ncbi:hypothetical protein H4W80_005709 [Nonomuraea angiospora]|uniref:Uncharacterized protein n=1 Tax=Nonomuraea angiospora TaxID=46172 RepID=A0ABR9M3E2_9ACTN|nr:hypothetical protein [Nonomuraea angiospora]
MDGGERAVAPVDNRRSGVPAEAVLLYSERGAGHAGGKRSQGVGGRTMDDPRRLGDG